MLIGHSLILCDSVNAAVIIHSTECASDASLLCKSYIVIILTEVSEQRGLPFKPRFITFH